MHEGIEYKPTEERLRRIEAQYRALVEQIPAITYTAALDDASTTMYVSPQIESILGFSPEDYRADPDMWRKRLHPDDRDCVLLELKQSHIDNQPFRSEYRMVARDGKVVWFSDEAMIVQDSAGKPLFIQGVMTDISERKRTEEALRASEKKYKELAELLPQVVFEMDLKGNLLFVNRQAFNIFGYSQENFDKGLNVMQMLAPFERERARENIQKSLIGDRPINFEYMGQKKDGSIFPFIVHSTPVIHDGIPVALRGLLIDISERKRAEENLKKSEERYRTIFENTTIGIFQTSIQGKLLRANPALAKMFGFASPDEMVASITDLGKQLYAHSEDRDRLKRLITENDIVENFEVEGHTKNGKSIWVSINIHAVRDQNGTILYFEGSNVDITKRKLAEDALRSNIETLQRSQKIIQQSNSLLESIMTSPKNIVIFALDREYRYIAFNKNHKDTMKAIWGVEIQIGVSMLEYIRDPEDREKAKINFDRALAGENFVLEEEYGDQSLIRHNYEDYYSPIWEGESAFVIGLTVFLTDVTV